MIYLDNAATTQISKKSQEARDFAENTYFSNSSSLHSFGMKSEELIDESKKIIGKVINANPNEIYFTKGATEANNIVISSFSGDNSKAITTSIEHSSVFDSFNSYPYKEVIYLKTDRHGFIDLEELKEKIDDDVKLVSIIYVNNEIGTIQDITSISKVLKDKNIILHIDATQALGKIDCDVKKLGVDLMSFSAHKFHGPKGVGGLYVKKNILPKLKPVLFGGRQQVISSGTDNHPAIYAMGVALNEHMENFDRESVKNLNLYMRNEILNNIEGIEINSPDDNFAPHILSVAFKNIKSEVLLHMLEQKEIYVSSGSACSKGNNNRILEALGVDDAYKDGVIRFSFTDTTSKEDIDKTIKVLKNSISEIRKVMIWKL